MTNVLKYKPTVLWRTLIKDVVMLSEFEYRLPVDALDITEIGANTIEPDFYLKDTVGNIYTIQSVDGNLIDVVDDFKVGVGPVSGFIGIIYKSVWSNRSPYIAPNSSAYLNSVSKSNNVDLDILFSNDPNAILIPFVNTQTPLLDDYQNTYAEDYGENPKVQLFTKDSDGVYWERQEKPIWYKPLPDGLLTKIEWDLSDLFTGYIILSK